MNSAEMRRCGKRYATEDEAYRSKKGRAGSVLAVPCRCGGWHLATEAKPAARKAPAASDTGPDAKTRHAVYTRDGWACVCCGQTILHRPHSIGHRLRRSQGLDNSLPNLLTLLGWGSDPGSPDDHHARIDSRRDPHDEASGYSLRSHQNPAAEGVLYVSEYGSGILMYLAEDGSLSPDPPVAGAVA